MKLQSDPYLPIVIPLLFSPGSLIIHPPKITSALTFAEPIQVALSLNTFELCCIFEFLIRSAPCGCLAVLLDSLTLPLEHHLSVNVEAADRQMKNETQSVVSQRANDACGDYRLQSAP